MSSFANKLREARIAAGLTQEQLGFAVDVTKASVSAWENGRETPSFRVLQLLPQAVGCSLDFLVCNADNKAAERQTIYQADHLYARDSAESALLQRFRNMTAPRRKALLDLMLPEANN